ncbi:hypothetical protein DERF_009174 [Dermatophagoides farinae]|uniref:Fatty acid hydroxylase domain-containing protein n=1 Tax=Dermatophagoides farinae TaxID=6954 RepID=A0A922HWQ8_DERFA|nr:hypothetical protein DERF_009174 [Dermatophagoides farinae]
MGWSHICSRPCSIMGVNFVYYWVHRSLHEINIFWASHQFHHNAVEVDVSVTLLFPTPLALLVLPPILLVHMQFSLIYQVWLHTEVVNRIHYQHPRQHRVHHGKNPWCIDKNYGALLMVFDRIFGTYQAEEEKIVFGTTENHMKHSIRLHCISIIIMILYGKNSNQ